MAVIIIIIITIIITIIIINGMTAKYNTSLICLFCKRNLTQIIHRKNKYKNPFCHKTHRK